jgi:8-amino-7-oxononanoate synthase
MNIHHIKKRGGLPSHNHHLKNNMVISEQENNLLTANGVVCVNFTSNDYLGLGKHPTITSAFLKGSKSYGMGLSTGNITTGYSAIQQKLERRFARWFNTEKALLFNSHYLANVSAISSLANHNDVSMSDQNCHASIYDGIILSRSQYYRYHQQPQQELIQCIHENKPDLIVAETTYNQSGDRVPVQSIIHACTTHGTKLIIDDAHGIGVYGHDGSGTTALLGITNQQYSCLIAPLANAFNSMGAIVAGDANVLDAIACNAHNYHNSYSLPPALCYALISTLDIIIQESWRRERLYELIHFFNKAALSRKLTLRSNESTPKRCIIVGNGKDVLKIQKKLYNKGFYVSANDPATHQAAIQLTLNCLHSEKNLLQVLDLLAEELNR